MFVDSIAGTTRSTIMNYIFKENSKIQQSRRSILFPLEFCSPCTRRKCTVAERIYRKVSPRHLASQIQILIGRCDKRAASFAICLSPRLAWCNNPAIFASRAFDCSTIGCCSPIGQSVSLSLLFDAKTMGIFSKWSKKALSNFLNCCTENLVCL